MAQAQPVQEKKTRLVLGLKWLSRF
jgi:hypothetical protein